MNRAEKLAWLARQQKIARLKQMQQQARAESAAPETSQQPVVDYPTQDQGATPEPLGGIPSYPQPVGMAESELPKTTPPEEFKHGLAMSGLETYMGVKDLVTGLSPENEAVMRMMREDAEQMGGAATAGRAVGELGQLAVPASWLSKSTKAINLGNKARMAGQVGLGAGYGATKLPEEGFTRAEGAAIEGSGALLGEAAGAALGKAIKGIKQKPEAQYLSDRGVELTPADAAEGRLPKAAQFLLENYPHTRRAVLDQKSAAAESYSKAFQREAAPEGWKDTITEGGTKGQRQLKKAYKEAYQNAWADAKKPSPEVINQIDDQLDMIVGDSAVGTGPVRRLDKKLEKALRNNESLEGLDGAVRRELSAQASSANPDPEVVSGLTKMRDIIQRSSGKKTKEALNKVDATYPNFLASQKAAASSEAFKRGGYPSVDEVATAARNVAGTSRAALGEAPLQDFVQAGQATLGDKLPQVMNTFKKGLGNVSYAPKGPLKLGADLTMGRTGGQRALGGLMDAFGRQDYVQPGTLGVAAEDDPTDDKGLYISDFINYLRNGEF